MSYTKTTDFAIQGVLTSKQIQRNIRGTALDTEFDALEAGVQSSVSVKEFGAVGDGVTDDTASIQAALDAAKEVYFPEGTYKVTENSITLPDNGKVSGVGIIKCTVATAAADNTHSNMMLITTTNNIVEGLSFVGVDNKCFAVGGLSDATHDCANVTVKGITATECGISAFEPYDGFSFNRHDEVAVSWIYTGQVTSAHKAQDIKVIDCVMYGDTTYNATTGNTDTSSVSGVQFLFCENAIASNCIVYNARFGAWSYGGSPKNTANTNLSTISNESKNIRFNNIIASDVYSGAWMSNTDDGSIVGCEISLFEDAQIDFEGCTNCIGANNIITDTIEKGLALTALNGCSYITFANNIFTTARAGGSTVFVRDGNDNITYTGNVFRCSHVTDKSKIKIWNTLSALTTNNSNIIIKANTFSDWTIEAQLVERVVIKDNTITQKTGGAYLLHFIDSDKVSIIDNTMRFVADYTSATAATSPVQIVAGSNTLDHTETIVMGNQLLGCTSTTGIYIQIASTSSPANDVKIMGNSVNYIFFDDTWLHSTPNQTKGKLVSFNNYSTIVEADHTPASTITRSSISLANERLSPTIMYGATGIGSLTGTYKLGDIIYGTTPTAGGTIGWICTTAGTPGTWKTFGSIAA